MLIKLVSAMAFLAWSLLTSVRVVDYVQYNTHSNKTSTSEQSSTLVPEWMASKSWENALFGHLAH